jgi:hypothetical protein
MYSCIFSFAGFLGISLAATMWVLVLLMLQEGKRAALKENKKHSWGK